MSTSSVITTIICAILVIAIGYALVKGLWSAAKIIVLPIEIVLFVVLLVCVGRLFCTKENAKKLYEGVEKTGISQNVENTVRSALNMKPADASKPEVKVAQVAPTPPPVADPALKAESAAPAQAPAVVTTEAKASPVAPQSIANPEPTPVKASDYSHLDKGKKTFDYALPFSSKVTVGFKENTYRVIAVSLGSLDASEKKEIGKLILTALGEYVGKTIVNWDKSKISIESRYDESDGHTRVFAIIPPDAIE